jgi:predicted Zn-dependent protease with MMP-like domain
MIPAKAADRAAVLIRIITPTQTCCRPYGLRLPRQGQLRKLDPKPIAADAGHALNRGMWTSAKAPSLAEMEAMAHEIFARLPKDFRDLCDGVILRVDDFPTEEVLDEMGAESEFDLLGLFQGIGLPFRSNQDIARLPNMVWLYRRPILDYWAEHEETLGHIVRHVLIHEIGHHFGLSDDDMAAIEANAD